MAVLLFISNTEMLVGDKPNNPQTVERKLATILSADVAQYSRLMAEDEVLIGVQF